MTLDKLLNIEHPIIQAPMAGVQDSELAIAVCHAGGLGSLPCAMLDAGSIRDEVSRIRSHTSGPFNVNFFCHSPPVRDVEREARWLDALEPYLQEFGIDRNSITNGPGRTPFNDDAVEVLQDLRPEVVSFHFGLPPAPLLRKIKSWNPKILSTATTVAEALWLQAQGVDGIIAQGTEAGGHRGHFLSHELSLQMGTMALVPQIVAAVIVPVIAAGGIASAEGVSAAMQLGAAGVQVGTSYLLCRQANTSSIHRAALSSARARHTAITNVFTGRPARSIVNRLIEEMGPINPLVPEFPLAAAAIAPLRTRTEALDHGDFTPLWAGQNTSGCQDISAGELTRLLAGAD